MSSVGHLLSSQPQQQRAWHDDEDDELEAVLPASHPHKVAAQATPQWLQEAAAKAAVEFNRKKRQRRDRDRDAGVALMSTEDTTSAAEGGAGARRRARKQKSEARLAVVDEDDTDAVVTEDVTDSAQAALDELLASAEAVAESRHHRTSGAGSKRQQKNLSSLSAAIIEPRRAIRGNVTDGTRTTDMEWHPSGELLIVGTHKALEIHHVSTRNMERQLVMPFSRGMRALQQVTLAKGGRSAVVVHSESLCPSMVDLTTATSTSPSFVPLAFIASAVRNQPNRVISLGLKRAAEDKKAEETIRKMSFAPLSSSSSSAATDDNLFAVAVGSALWLGSLTHGAMRDTVRLAEPIADMCWVNSVEILVASGDVVRLFDVRKLGVPTQTYAGDGTACTMVASLAGLTAVGCASGAVLYRMGSALSLSSSTSSSAPPQQTSATSGRSVFARKASPFDGQLLNCRTEIDLLDIGLDHLGNPGLIFGSSTQTGGIRFASFPEARVATQFPPGGANRGFIKSVAACKSVGSPLLAVAEANRIDLYMV